VPQRLGGPLFGSKVILDSVWKADLEQPMTAEETAQWQRDAMKWLQEAADDEVAGEGAAVGEQRRKKLLRVASYRHQVGIDNALQSAFGGQQGLSMFLPSAGPQSEELPFSQKPCLVLHEDRHSVNMCGAFYLLNKHKARLM
jgi:hypothetical protein